jgi:hypothetical protein
MQKTIYFTDKEDQELDQLAIAWSMKPSSVIRLLVAEKFSRLSEMGLIKTAATCWSRLRPSRRPSTFRMWARPTRYR